MNSNHQAVYVWDPHVRLFHWSLVVSFSVAYLTEDNFMSLHEVAGYTVLGLVGFRVVWGLIGSKHARFSDFIYGPEKIKSYLKSLLSGKPEHYTGHNPAGGLMVITLLVMLGLTSWSGIKAYDAERGVASAPTMSIISSAYADDDHDDRHEHDGDEFWEEIHEALAEFTLFLVFIHIAAVVISSVLHGENLVRAMISGYKEKDE